MSHTHSYIPKRDSENNIVWADGREANCLIDGVAIYVCSCGETKEEVLLGSATGHNFSDVSFDDNCETHDNIMCTSHTKKCKLCNGYLVGGSITKGHIYGEWYKIDDEIRRDCNECEHYEKCEHYENGVSVTFIANGGNWKANIPPEFEDEPNTFNKIVYMEKGTTLVFPGEESISKYGMQLSYWKCNENKTSYHIGEQLVINTNLTFTAQWTGIISWYDEDKTTVLDTNTYNEEEKEPIYNKILPVKAKDKNYTYEFEKWILQDIPLNDDNISYVAQYRKIPIEYGSYVVKHEYYTRDKKGNLILDKTVLEDEVIMEVGRVIDTNSIERKSENYMFSEISEQITIEKDEQKIITLKYIKDGEDIDKIDTSDINIWLYVVIAIISIMVIVIAMIIKKKNKSK